MSTLLTIIKSGSKEFLPDFCLIYIMKLYEFFLFFGLILSFCLACTKRKESHVPVAFKETEAIVMPVSIISDTSVYEMKIVPDTFSVFSDRIPVVLLNHLKEDAFYGDDISREYYNDSIGKWENAYTPSNLISTYTLWRLPAQSDKTVSFSIYDHRPGKYRFKVTILKPRQLMVVGEFVLSDTSDIVRNECN